MDNQPTILLLTTVLTTTIGAIVSGIYSILGKKIQAQLEEKKASETPKVLLPPGVEIRRSDKKSKKFLQRFAVLVTVGLLIGVIIGVILQGSQPTGNSTSSNVLANLAYVLAVILILGIIAYGGILLKYQDLGARKWSLTIAISVTLVLVLAASYFMLSAFLEERTVYFIVDASANAQDVSQEIFGQTSLGLEQIPDNVDVGLAVFGGRISGLDDCYDITELVKPSPKQESIPEMNQAIRLLSKITPSGESALQNSIVSALSSLTSRQGVQQIIVVTASLDSTCGRLDRKFLDTIASRSNIKYEIVMIYIGELSEEDSKTLSEFSNRFANIRTSEELSNIIQDVFFVPPSLYQIYEQVYYPYYGQ